MISIPNVITPITCIFLYLLVFLDFSTVYENITGVGVQTNYYESCLKLKDNECVLVDRREITFKTDFNNQKVYGLGFDDFKFENIECRVFDSKNWYCYNKTEIHHLGMINGQFHESFTYNGTDELVKYNMVHDSAAPHNLFTFFTMGIPMEFGLTKPLPYYF
jgi:hypothetical protein